MRLYRPENADMLFSQGWMNNKMKVYTSHSVTFGIDRKANLKKCEKSFLQSLLFYKIRALDMFKNSIFLRYRSRNFYFSQISPAFHLNNAIPIPVFSILTS